MARCSTPDRLIGIGGGGSRIVYRFMQQEWLLEDVMKTEEYDEPEPDTLRATVIDSAVDDDFHSTKAAAVKKKVEEAHEGTEFLPEDRFLEFDGPHLISEMIPNTWRNESLTAPPSVRDLCHDQGLNSWWLKEGREPLSKVNDEGFHGGVLRRRSMSKLLFHISEYTDESVVPNGPGEDEVYIVAALGGGTGSGMALDLASSLEAERIHLFGVLPHENAGGLEKTNAHAALSELEYAHLTGEGPFDTITLAPHLEELENADRDFEMGVVRSILAHQNAVRSENITNYLTPDKDTPTNPPKYAPFTIAAPYTIKYDIGVHPEAKQAVGEFLDAKAKELRSEDQLYTVIKEYLENAFKDTAGKELAGRGSGTLDTERGREAAYQLRERVEDYVRGSMLEQQALELAELGDLVTDLQNGIDSIPRIEPPGESDEGGERGRGDGSDPMTEAVEFVDKVPEMILSRLEDSGEFDYRPDDDLVYDLVEVVKQEMENVATRRDIWKAISTITAENTNLEPDEADLVRTALRDVIMDPDREFLSDVFQNPSIQDMANDWRSQLNALEGTVDELEGFYEEVARDLKSRSNDWNEDAYEEAKTLAAINEHEETVEDALNDLIRVINNAVERVENASTEEAVDDVSLEDLGPLNHMDIPGVRPLNEKLEEMCVETVPIDAIATGFGFVKDARKNKLNHGGGWKPWGNGDKSGAFNTNVTEVRENGWFEINPTSPDPTVTEGFSCRFKHDRLRRESEMETNKDELSTIIVEKFEDAFIEDDGFVNYSFEYSTNMAGTDSKTISLPQGLDQDDIEMAVKKRLRDTEKTKAGALLDDTLPMNAIDPTDPKADIDVKTSTTRMLVEAYLRPVKSEYEDVEERVEKLSGGDENLPVGLVDRFELLRGLSTGRVARDDLELPQTNPYKQGNETYGRSFAWNYEGLYEVDFDYEGIDQDDTQNHPYLRPDKADIEDMPRSPDDIGDTEILEDKEKRIVRFLANSVSDLLNNEHGRAPINNLSPKAIGHKVMPPYKQIRISPIYMSRALEDHKSINEQYEKVKSRFADEVEFVTNDMYNPDVHSTGDPDEITMVTFIGGLFLDNIELVTKRGGYQDTYERNADTSFIAHHTIGLGGMWDRWSTMHEWVTEDGEPFYGSDFGAFVYRDTTRKVDREFMSEIMISDKEGDDTREIFLNMLRAEPYESTVDITEKVTDADD